METLLQDLRYGARLLIKNRSFAAIAILTLALGIGANTAIFSAVNTLLLGPLPVADDTKLVYGIGLREGYDPFGTSLLEYNAYRAESRAFTNSGIALPRFFNLIERGNPERLPGAEVTADYLNTLGVELVSGRLIDEQDRADGQMVVVVSEELARQAWPDADPIGKRIRRGRGSATGFAWMIVVGVVKDVKEDRANFRINRAVWYLPYAQHSLNLPVNLVMRTTVDPGSLSESVRATVRAVDPNQPIAEVTTMRDHVAGVTVTERFSAVLLALLAGMGLLLAALGLYGVMTYTVTERTGEIGLRMALGAGRRDIFILILKQGSRLIVPGVILGVAGAILLTRLLAKLLYEVKASDPVTFIVVALLLTGVALVACFVPARRAMKVDPVVALKYE